MKTYLYPLDGAYEVEVEVEYDASYSPARGMSGPWEDSSPADSDLSLTGYKVLSITPIEDDALALTDDHIEGAYVAAQDRLEDECWDDFMGSQHEGCHDD